MKFYLFSLGELCNVVRDFVTVLEMLESITKKDIFIY